MLGAGFIPNLVYCVFLLIRNRTIKLYCRDGWKREALIPVVMDLAWAAAILSYGHGTTVVGMYGTSVGYMLLTASCVLFANTFDILAGKWKNTSVRTWKLLISVLAYMLIAVVVLNLGGMF